MLKSLDVIVLHKRTEPSLQLNISRLKSGSKYLKLFVYMVSVTTIQLYQCRSKQRQDSI